MTIPPITIPELDPAGPIDVDNDQLLIRQGLNDRRASPSLIAGLKLQSFPSLNASISTADVILIGKNNGGGTYQNTIADPRRLGFLEGVITWFYGVSAPLYWTSVPSLGDRVLAVQGGSESYQNIGLQGTWQQPDHTLSVSEIPPHNHRFDVSFSSADSTGELGVPRAGKQKISGYRSTTLVDGGGGQSHNHGNTYRPAGVVGLVCQKTG